MWARPANVDLVSRLLVQVQRRVDGQTVETTLVCLRSHTTQPTVLHRQDGETHWRRLHLVSDDPRCVRRSRAAVTQYAPGVYVLRQDARPIVVSNGPNTRDDAHMDRRNFHRRRGLSTVRLTTVIAVIRILRPYGRAQIVIFLASPGGTTLHIIENVDYLYKAGVIQFSVSG